MGKWDNSVLYQEAKTLSCSAQLIEQCSGHSWKLAFKRPYTKGSHAGP